MSYDTNVQTRERMAVKDEMNDIDAITEMRIYLDMYSCRRDDFMAIEDYIDTLRYETGEMIMILQNPHDAEVEDAYKKQVELC